jgi:hypothetical protein
MSGAIETHHSIEGFFADLIRDALLAERLNLDEQASSYLLQLVTEFSQREALYGGCARDEKGTPALVWLYERAVAAGPQAQFNAYRHLGDVALVVSGFFAQHIERSLVDVGYYVGMGGAAYDRAAVLSRSGFGAVLKTLSEHFRKLVDVLARVADQTTLAPSADIATLYERWIDGGGPDAVRRLQAHGAFPVLLGARAAS